MATNSEATIKEGIRLYKAGKKSEARELWEQVTEADPYNEQAWLWLSAVVESVDDQRTCLENVLYVNPNNANAKKGLAMLDEKHPPADPPAAEPTPSRSSTPPTATSSASSTYTPEEPEPEVYDSWIDSLNLNNAAKPAATEYAAAPDLFDDDAFSDELADSYQFESDDDDHDDGDYDDLNAIRSYAIDDDDVFDDPFADDPFAENDITSGPFRADSINLGIDDDDDDLRTSARLPDGGGRNTIDTTPKQKTQRKAPSPRMDTGDADDDFDDSDPSVYFAMIPANIKATRLPGTDATNPLLLRLLVGVLAVANLGALGLLIFRLVG